jgi:hypothetical protein
MNLKLGEKKEKEVVQTARDCKEKSSIYRVKKTKQNKKNSN